MTLLDRIGPIAQVVVSLLVVSAFLGAIAALYELARQAVELPPGVKEVLLVLIGVLAGAFKDVVGYWIGSSLGSARKDAAMRQP